MNKRKPLYGWLMTNGQCLEENVNIGICIYDTYVYLYTFTYLISDYFKFFFSTLQTSLENLFVLENWKFRNPKKSKKETLVPKFWRQQFQHQKKGQGIFWKIVVVECMDGCFQKKKIIK